VISGGAAIVVVTLGWLGSSYLAGMRNAEFWESTIAGFEELDRANPPEPGAILFTGSSSIVMWETLARDMSPLRVLNRGFGGSQIDHVSHYVTRVVHPYRPSAVVLYAGDNDLASGTGKTAESVFADFREFVRLVHAELPGVPIYFIAIKPSTLRWDRWPIMSDANGRIAKWSGETDDVDYIDIATPMLGESGEPDSELFLLDGLHLSEEGYALWTGVVKPFLVERHGS
jgi:lysophospholipase L1-like esterase